MNEIEPVTPPAVQGTTNRAVILAFLIGGFALVTISMLAQKFRNPEKRNAPLMAIVGDSLPVTNPVAIRFVTKAALTNGAQGWTAGDLHPHALFDQEMIMPMGPDIVKLAGDTFSLTMPRLDPGTHHVRLYWADGAHKAVGDSARVILTVTH